MAAVEDVAAEAEAARTEDEAMAAEAEATCAPFRAGGAGAGAGAGGPGGGGAGAFGAEPMAAAPAAPVAIVGGVDADPIVMAGTQDGESTKSAKSEAR